MMSNRKLFYANIWRKRLLLYIIQNKHPIFLGPLVLPDRTSQEMIAMLLYQISLFYWNNMEETRV